MGGIGATDVQFFEAGLRQIGTHRSAANFLLASAPTEPQSAEVRASSLHWDMPEYHEFSLVTDGNARVVTLADVFDLTPGQLLVIERGVGHDERPVHQRRHYKMFWCGMGDTVVRLSQTSYSPPSLYRAGPAAACWCGYPPLILLSLLSGALVFPVC